MNTQNSDTSMKFARRELLAVAAAAVPAFWISKAWASPRTPIPLPYDMHALEPAISGNTLGFHYGKHYQGYLTNLDKLTAGTEWAEAPLDRIVLATAGAADKTAIFNNAAQAWNHEFYWRSLRPNGGGVPPASLAQRLSADFGSFDAFKKELATAATTQFGSGWAWLVVNRDGKLAVVSTPNQDTPLEAGARRVVLGVDVWEHAYYLKYQNRRADYLAAWWNVVNWDKAQANFANPPV